MKIWTFGHSIKSFEEIVQSLKAHGITKVVDIRRFPRSRHCPQSNDDVLQPGLPANGIKYVHLPDLAGMRPKSKNPGPNDAWNGPGFRNFSDYALTAEFAAGVKKLVEHAEHDQCTIMCAEVLWWKCHRRVITDHLLANGFEVMHIYDHRKVEPASMTPWGQKRPRDDELLKWAVVYPRPEGAPPPEKYTKPKIRHRKPKTDEAAPTAPDAEAKPPAKKKRKKTTTSDSEAGAAGDAGAGGSATAAAAVAAKKRKKPTSRAATTESAAADAAQPGITEAVAVVAPKRKRAAAAAGGKSSPNGRVKRPSPSETRAASLPWTLRRKNRPQPPAVSGGVTADDAQ